MSRHVKETNLALFVSGDLSLFERAAVRFHLSGCENCRARLEAFRFDRQRLKEDAGQLPTGLDWDRLAQEMTANIRVGLAAGECVAPRARKQASWNWGISGRNWNQGRSWNQGWAPGRAWMPAAVMAAVAMILSAAWWLNLPSSDTASLGRALNKLVHGREPVVREDAPAEESGPVVHATANSIELRENGNSLVMSQGSTMPVSVNVGAHGSSASYVNDAGEITLTGVYVQ
ncbi:MAG TPA: zf-HC2 domain-containing protein [Bryobacteraceae bacterium]